jgi:methylaspartate ammonia-lyase
MEIARTILEQIKYVDKWALMAYGATNFIALQETKDFQGGVKFKVNGLKHKGTVMVQLKWIDTYTITFVNNNGVAVKEVEDVYCDTLVDVLDYIEGK